MKQVTIKRKSPASEKSCVREFAPQSDPTAGHYSNRIVMNVFGKRFELTRHTEVRVITKGPAKVVEMPKRSAI